MEKLAILVADEDWVRLYFPYNPDFLNRLKATVPGRDREPVWAERGGRRKFDHWRLRRTWVNEVVELMEQFWPGREIESDLVEDDGDQSPFDYIFGLCKDGQDAKRLYSALAFITHPDRGGSEEDFKRLKEAYERRTDEGSH